MEETEDKETKINLENYRVHAINSSAYYIGEFVSASEERSLLDAVYAAPKPKWTQLAHRRLQNWGGLPTARGMVAEPVPRWLTSVMARVTSLGPFGAVSPNHVLVNEYQPGQGIMPHLDGDLFHPVIATVSLGSHTVLRFKDAGSLLLEPRSLLILRDNLYTSHMHYIEEVTKDMIDESLCNLDLCSSLYEKGSTVSRDTRVSLTIRHVPKTTSFKICIGNKR